MKILVLLTFVFTAFFSYSQNNDCESFRKGKYFYTPPNGGEVTFKRTKKKQKERYNDEHQRFIFRITWTAECEYELELIKTRGVNKNLKNEIIGTKLYCKILKAEFEQYKVEIVSEDRVELVTIYEK